MSTVPGATKRAFKESGRERLNKVARSLEQHADRIRATTDPNKLRSVAGFVRNCAWWIDTVADEEQER